ncbi:MAG: ABC transporter permease [Kofleriaceae bacterium]
MMALRRIAWSLLVVWFVVTIAFVMVHAIPADPARTILGPRATPAAIAKVEAYYCLDRGIVARYGCWLDSLAHGDLGESYRTNRPVTAILGDRVWPTVQLALAAIVLQLLIGIPLGILAAVRRGRWPDRSTGILVMLGQSAPPFVVGTLLLWIVAYRWDVLPLGGYGSGFWDRIAHLILPALTLASGGVAYYARITRSELGETLSEDYVRTARSKGLPERTVVLRHALRPALGPIITLVGLDLGVLAGGAVVTESVFAWPGLGRETLQAILDVDMPVVLGVVIVAAVAIAVANLAVDLVQLYIDPRLRDR